MIKIENLHKSYGSSLVLKGINLEIKKGEIFAILGHSGAGKSTLMRCINALESYQEGSVKVFDREVKDLCERELRELRREIGMIFQHFALLSRKRAWENVALPLLLHGEDKNKAKSRAMELLELVGIKERAQAYPGELSGGQKQRVAIARALSMKPKIILSDEATSALDPNTTNQILDLLQEINETLGISIVLVTHEMHALKRIAHRALLLEGGCEVASGSVMDLFLHPKEKMREFLGEDAGVLPEGCNLRLVFPKDAAQSPVISRLARELNVDASIVWGKIELLNGHAVGNLTINIDESKKDEVLEFLEREGVIAELLG